MNFLLRVTKPVNHINDFSKLPIPFKCMAVDIVNVKPVVLDHGCLALAMRASMAIPTIFKPVSIDGKLLIDGGLMENFPVKLLKDMGADIIIGSYTGGRLFEENELNTVNKLLIQSNSFYGISIANEDKKLCDIFNNLTENMKQFQAGDFSKSDKILEAGNIISSNILPQLTALSDSLKENGITYKNPGLNTTTHQIKIKHIYIDSTSDKRMKKFVDKRISFDEGDSISIAMIEKTVRKIYGTRFFYKTYYTLDNADSGAYNVSFKFEKDDKFRLKGALHYDNELGSGIILNLTARNWLGKMSRFSTTVDIAKSFKYRIDYRKYIGQSQLSFNGMFLRENTFFNLFNDSVKVSSLDFNNLYRSLNMGFNLNLSFSSAIYAGLMGELFVTKPKYSLKKVDIFNINKYDAHLYSFVIKFLYNTLDNAIVPKKGMEIMLQNKFVPFSEENFDYTLVYIDSILQSNNSTKNYVYYPYDKLQGKIKIILPVSKRTSSIFNLNTGLRFQTRKGHPVFNYELAEKGLPAFDIYTLGGIPQKYAANYIPVWGINENQYNVNNFTCLQIGIQQEVITKLFITPAFTYVYYGDNIENYFRYLKNINLSNKQFTDNNHNCYHTLYTYGLNFAYKSPIGPIVLNLSNAPLYNNLIGYISIGFTF